MEEEKPDKPLHSPKKTSTPGMKRKDGTYIAATVPPEWEA
jgi:hypothetical protein